MTTDFEFDFNLGDGWFGNIECTIEEDRYVGLMYSTNEMSEYHLWAQEFDEYFADSNDMLKWAMAIIRENNT